MREKLSNLEIAKRGTEVVMNTYSRLPIAMVGGEGAWVWDIENNRYLDFVTGLAVNSLGYKHPEIVAAIQKQADQIVHTSNLYWIPSQVELAESLVNNSFADKVFFCNSGAEANEAAIKLARKYAKRKYGPDKYEVISMENSFHGRTLATLTATGQSKYQVGYEPLPSGFSYIGLNNVAELKNKVNNHTAAVLIEPIQGEGGIYPASWEFLQLARELCDQYGALLIFDEVQCGLGRTGKLFAYEWSGVSPDVMTLAKALGGGVPIGAMLATDEVAGAFQPGDHASTFGGNYLATAAGQAVLKALLADGFLPAVEQKAEYFSSGLKKLAAKYGLETELRGRGFMLGWEIGNHALELVGTCRAKGLLLNCVGGKILRFLPPLTVTQQELDLALDILNQALGEVAGE